MTPETARRLIDDINCGFRLLPPPGPHALRIRWFPRVTTKADRGVGIFRSPVVQHLERTSSVDGRAGHWRYHVPTIGRGYAALHAPEREDYLDAWTGWATTLAGHLLPRQTPCYADTVALIFRHFPDRWHRHNNATDWGRFFIRWPSGRTEGSIEEMPALYTLRTDERQALIDLVERQLPVTSTARSTEQVHRPQRNQEKIEQRRNGIAVAFAKAGPDVSRTKLKQSLAERFDCHVRTIETDLLAPEAAGRLVPKVKRPQELSNMMNAIDQKRRSS